jgi:hypothetical protein
MAVVSLVLDREPGAVICDACHVAETPVRRMRGLLGRRELKPGEGLLLRPAPAVHTWFMRFPIDVVFLDSEMHVLKVAEHVEPWRMTTCRHAKSVLELRAGECERRGIGVGDRLSMGGFSVTRSDRTSPAGWARLRAGDRAAARWLIVGFLAATLAAFMLVHDGVTARGAIESFVACVLVLLAGIDLERRIIPNKIVIPAAAVVLVAQLAAFPDQAGEWVLASLGAATFLFLPSLLNPNAIGMGDVKLGLLLGAGLGRDVLAALTLGFLSVFPVALYLLVRHGPAARTSTLPLGPFLAFGALVALYT